MDILNGSRHHDVAGGVLDDVEGLKDRHTGIDQRAKSTRESGNGHLFNHGTDDWEKQAHLVQNVTAEVGATNHGKGEQSGEHAGQCAHGVIFNCVTDVQDNCREFWKPRPHHLGKHILELGDDEHQQNAHDDDRDHEHCDRVKHGGLDLPLNSHGLLHELGQAIQHHFQHTAQLARLDHAHEQLVEHLGVLGQALGKGAASLDHLGQFAQHTSQRGIFLLPLEHS